MVIEYTLPRGEVVTSPYPRALTLVADTQEDLQILEALHKSFLARDAMTEQDRRVILKAVLGLTA